MSILTHLSTIEPGDSGAWVVDSAGQLFGHIVAGDPMLGLAFIIPAYKIFDDIKNRFGEEPLLCPSPSVMQPFSAPNDGKVAEQPLPHWIQDNDCNDWIHGKETVSLLWTSGSLGAGKTVLVQHLARHINNSIRNDQTLSYIFFFGSPRAGKTAMAQHYARHVNSIGNGHLEEGFTKLKETAEMMRKQCAEMLMANFLQILGQEVFDERMAVLEERTKLKMYIAETMRTERAEKRMANFLQTVVQEVPDVGTAFFQGDPSDKFLIMIDALDECMPATFSVTAISAKPSSFASIVPRTGAYSHIDGYHETTSDAAEGENRYFQNEILVWRYSPRKL